MGKSVRLHGEAGEIDHEQIKEKIDEIRKELESYDLEILKTSTIGMKQTYTSSLFLILLIRHEMKQEDEFVEQKHMKAEDR